MSIAQAELKVKNFTNQITELLALADRTLEQAQRHRAAWLATGSDEAWRLAEVAEADRAALLAEVGR